MAVEIRPEPTPAEREALLRALIAVDGLEQRAQEPPAWWQAGIREAVEDEPAGQDLD